MHDEARWAAQIARGEAEAFARFVDAFGPRVHRLARRFARDECDAEDLTQEIFVALFQSAGSFRGEARLSTWVYRVALNHGLRHREKSGRAASTSGAPVPEDPQVLEAPDPGANPARDAARGELGTVVRESVRELSDGHRDVIVLHELHGLSYRECAEVLGVPVGTVKSRLSNAFGHLRRKLAPYVLPPEASSTSGAPAPSTSAPAPVEVPR